MKSIFIPILIVLSVLTLNSCTRNAITGRKQASLVSESELRSMASTQYRQFLSESKVLGSSSPMKNEYLLVQKVGARIADAITKYYTQQGLGKELEGYEWEFNLVQGDDVNAFCMPGGKVVVYTGLLPVAQNEAGLAVVMGHEIAHAVLRHGSERMSRAAGAQLGGQITGAIIGSQNKSWGNLFENIYSPVATTAIILPNSRAQESEADRFGLRFAALAGYDPREAVPFWIRMAQISGNSNTPVFLRTHPTNQQRVSDLQKIMPEALQFYKPIVATTPTATPARTPQKTPKKTPKK